MNGGEKGTVESRRSVRVPVRLSVGWIRRGKRSEVVVVDVSLHGLFFRTDQKPKPGSLLLLEVTFPGGIVVRMFVVARFVGSTISGTGVGAEIFLADDSVAWRQYYQAELSRHRAGTRLPEPPAKRAEIPPKRAEITR